MDALGLLDGNIHELTPTAWKRVASARKEIQSASPEVTADQIRQRAENYRTYFSGAALTSTALAKHWAKCEAPNTKGTQNGNHAPIHRGMQEDIEIPILNADI